MLSNCLQPMAIRFGWLRSTAIEGSLAASPRMLAPVASTLAWVLVKRPNEMVAAADVAWTDDRVRSGGLSKDSSRRGFWTSSARQGTLVIPRLHRIRRRAMVAR